MLSIADGEMKAGGSGAECLEVGKMNNFESEKKNHPVEVIDDVLEQVSGGINEPFEPDTRAAWAALLSQNQNQERREGNYGTETEKIV